MSTTEGTWCFWAPEMCETREYGAAFNAYAADSWAAGVTLWCFLYGRVPFFGLVVGVGSLGGGYRVQFTW